jgi:diacylglycerol kinase (ATP)
MRFVFIVNRQAGKGKCKKKWSRFFEATRSSIGDHDVYYTSKAGEAEGLARKEVEKKTEKEELAVVAVGGDGTASEVLNGVAGSEVTIGILPFGTGNDLAKGLGISSNLRSLIDIYKKNTHSILKINVAKMNERYFASSAGVGFDGLVADYANRRALMKHMGKLGYLLSALKLVGRFSPKTFSVLIDEESYHFSQAWLLAIGNGPYYGGGMKICPNAQLDDDLLDLCVVSNLSKLKFFQLFPSVYKGSHIKQKKSVTLLRGQTIEIHADSSQSAHADGEFIQSQVIKIQLCPFKQAYLI